MTKFFSGAGDEGTSTFYGSGERHPKNNVRFEALGSLDELNSYIGVAKAHSDIPRISAFLEEIQENLFTIQAEIGAARAPSVPPITEQKLKDLEAAIANFGEEVGEIRTFIIPGGTPLAAHLEYARTLARKAERRVTPFKDELAHATYVYLNRLSSALFVLARYANKYARAEEKGPSYQ
ncbi:MAG: ATP:cob(I)alamin adenosyltransferase [Candidatus Sungbacteria bacterium RIFCSPHIGHO2_01_FULL_51_22]|nr:MAG: ATP:cob(I)alamin adenosyltransferase [Candidatus Sungbacteria bacterium RIFCSPHIGHO2_01_FULL_51_22]OHA05543.1 MAG: ATP:cob(I)alamin adenosyltransferase [Candidatus Sungbacteria bacterium RIFCSPLOWO2_01_FULL_51_34]